MRSTDPEPASFKILVNDSQRRCYKTTNQHKSCSLVHKCYSPMFFYNISIAIVCICVCATHQGSPSQSNFGNFHDLSACCTAWPHVWTAVVPAPLITQCGLSKPVVIFEWANNMVSTTFTKFEYLTLSNIVVILVCLNSFTMFYPPLN